MKVKLKICCACEKPSVIWKNDGGNLFCKNCWYIKNPVKIPHKSDKQKTRDMSYALLRKAFLIKNSVCLAKLPGCTGASSEIHHIKGRIGKLLLDISNFLPICRSCHNEVENNPNMAKELKLSKSRLSKDE